MNDIQDKDTKIGIAAATILFGAAPTKVSEDIYEIRHGALLPIHLRRQPDEEWTVTFTDYREVGEVKEVAITRLFAISRTFADAVCDAKRLAARWEIDEAMDAAGDHVRYRVPLPASEDAELRKAAGELVDAWEEQFGEGACDCRTEPENEGDCCPQCRIQSILHRGKYESI
jgi:hypothetical protein